MEKAIAGARLASSTGAAGQLVTSHSTDLIYLAEMRFGTEARCCRSGKSPKSYGVCRHVETPTPCATRTRAPNGPKNAIPQKPYDDPKFASHVLYLSANNFADGFVPFIARVISS